LNAVSAKRLHKIPCSVPTNQAFTMLGSSVSVNVAEAVAVHIDSLTEATLRSSLWQCI